MNAARQEGNRTGARWPRFRGDDPRPRAAAVTAAVLSGLIVGCTGAPEVASVSPSQLATLAEIDRLLNTTLTDEDQAALVNAHGLLVEDCMQALGWDFRVDFAGPETVGGGPETLSQLEQWSFADPDAPHAGYGLDPYLASHEAWLADLGASTGRGHAPDPAKMRSADSARYEIDMFGRDDERIEITERDGSHASVPGGGCAGTANLMIYGDVEQQLRLQDARTTAQAEIWEHTLADEAAGATHDTWRKCLKAGGFEYEDPELAFSAALTAALADDRHEERRIAATVAHCTETTGLGRAVQAAFLSAATVIINDLEDDLIALQQFEEEALARATRSLQGGG